MQRDELPAFLEFLRGGIIMPTEKEIKIIQQATLYERRRLIKKSGKDYTNEEICDLLDTIAEAKDQE